MLSNPIKLTLIRWAFASDRICAPVDNATDVSSQLTERSLISGNEKVGAPQVSLQRARDDPVSCRWRAGDCRLKLQHWLYIRITSGSRHDHHRYYYFYVIGVWFGILLFDVSFRLLLFFLLIYIRVSIAWPLLSRTSLFYLLSLSSHFSYPRARHKLYAKIRYFSPACHEYECPTRSWKVL